MARSKPTDDLTLLLDALSGGELDEAERVVRKASLEAGTALFCEMGQALVQERRGDQEQLLGLLDGLRKRAAREPDRAVDLAVDLINHRSYPVARGLLEGASRGGRRDEAVLINLGLCQLAAGERKKATETTLEAVLLGHNNGRAFHNLGVILDSQPMPGSDPLVCRCAAQAYRLSPDNSLYHKVAVDKALRRNFLVQVVIGLGNFSLLLGMLVIGLTRRALKGLSRHLGPPRSWEDFVLLPVVLLTAVLMVVPILLGAALLVPGLLVHWLVSYLFLPGLRLLLASLILSRLRAAGPDTELVQRIRERLEHSPPPDSPATVRPRFEGSKEGSS